MKVLCIPDIKGVMQPALEGAMAQYGDGKLCFRPFYPEISQQTFLVWKKYQPMSRAQHAFIDEVSMLLAHNEA